MKFTHVMSQLHAETAMLSATYDSVIARGTGVTARLTEAQVK